jgi:hypothetical protein
MAKPADHWAQDRNGRLLAQPHREFGDRSSSALCHHGTDALTASAVRRDSVNIRLDSRSAGRSHRLQRVRRLAGEDTVSGFSRMTSW